MRILVSKTIGPNRETWYMFEGTSRETKPVGEYPSGSGHKVADGSRLYETDTEITYELKSNDWSAIGQIDIELIEKSITENGVYNPGDDDEVDGYSKVNVDVSGVEFDKLPATFSLLTNIKNLSVDIPEGVTSISQGAFSSCKGLKAVTIPSSVLSIGNVAFQSCTGLTEIEIPSSVTSIGANAFYGCTNLAQITINKAEGSIENSPWGATNATVIWTGEEE